MKNIIVFNIISLLFIACNCKHDIEKSIRGTLVNQLTNNALKYYPLTIQYSSTKRGELGGCLTSQVLSRIDTDSVGIFEFHFNISAYQKEYALLDTNNNVILKSENSGDLGILYITP